MNNDYLMEHSNEALRLELKTDLESVIRQAKWAGIKPGMRVADIGCGPGKTTACLRSLVGPSGEAVGVDASEERILYANVHYGSPGLTYECRNVLTDLTGLGTFDFIWVRFFLEYFRAESKTIAENLSKLLNPGGILCLIDLDHNCLNHYGIPARLERAISSVMGKLEEEANFDPYVGRKLYSYLFDAELEDIDVMVTSHNVIFSECRPVDLENWGAKIEVATAKINYDFPEYPGGRDEFRGEWKDYFASYRRFTYTPLILCRGVRASNPD